MNEVQCHGGPVTRLRITYDNKLLFSTGKDGSIMILEVKDKDPRGGNLRERDVMMLEPSEEILTEKSEMDEYKT
jgi:cilia- and flagella-associated protein 57